MKAVPRLALAALLLAAGGCSRAVSVTRLVPAPYNLGPARRLVLVEVGGDFLSRSDAAAAFLSAVGRGGVFEVRDATHAYTELSALGAGAAARKAKEFRAEWPADAYVGLVVGEPEARDRREKTTEKRDGKEVEVVRHWAEGRCSLRVRILDGQDGRLLADYDVVGEGRSDDSEHASSQQRLDARSRALDAAVAAGVAGFTPERVDEWIVLEEEAPLAKEGLALLDKKDLAGARALWEKARATYPNDARLAYNVGAVCEALGDRRAARAAYENAVALAPGEPRYRKALDDLDARRRDARALRTKP